VTLLNPENRSLYVDALRPPPGLVFDRGLATSYSLDLDTLLSLPLHLVLYAGESPVDELLHQGVALLDALRRTTRRLSVYVNRGRIAVPRSARALFSLLEPVIHEVNLAESAGSRGAFHPKVWLLRFASPADGPKRDPLYRLLVLTRNLTFDVSWDVGLVLEGTPDPESPESHRPLITFLEALEGALPPALLAEVARVRWDLPEGFHELGFHDLRPGAPPWRPPRSDRLVVVSPFCGDRALATLAETTKAPEALVTRVETLGALDPRTRARFGRCLCLHEAAETEDGEELEETSANTTSAGLHAKLYLLERDREVRLIMGSANATEAVVEANQNVEFLVELVGRKGPAFGIDAFLADEGFGAMLVDGLPLIGERVDETDREQERRFEDARTALRNADLRLVFTREDDVWRTTLRSAEPIALDPRLDLRAWPVTVADEHGRAIGGLRTGGDVELGSFAPQSVTSLLAFEVRERGAAAKERIRFVLNLTVEGLPVEIRDAALTRQIVNNQESFLRYLLLLLGDLDVETGESGLLGAAAFIPDEARAFDFDELPILEEMARSFARSPDRLTAVDELMERLRAHSEGDEDVVPEDFHRLWDTVQAAMREGA
jgi:hypothetical protein